jgi:N-acetylneuraminic acid mutarotase
MPKVRAAASAIVLNERIFVFGGAALAGGIASKYSFEYDPATDSWRTLDEMPFGRFVMTISVVNGKIYMIGGSGTKYPHQPYLAEVLEISP